MIIRRRLVERDYPLARRLESVSTETVQRLALAGLLVSVDTLRAATEPDFDRARLSQSERAVVRAAIRNLRK